LRNSKTCRRSVLSCHVSSVALSPAGVAAFWLIGRRAGDAYLIYSETLLAEPGVTALLLEVMTTDAGTLAAYRRMGFATVRTLQCYDLPAFQDGDYFCGWKRGTGVRHWQPASVSWIGSRSGRTRRAPLTNPLLCRVCRDGHDPEAYSPMDAASGMVFQLAVRADGRRVQSCAGSAGRAFDTFLMRSGAAKTVRQLEMIKLLSC
jgi:hypothetical protein